MSWQRDRDAEMMNSIRKLGEAVERFVSRLEAGKSVDKGEKGGKDYRERFPGGGKTEPFEDIERAGERLTGTFLGMVPGLSTFHNTFKRLQSGLTDLATVIEGPVKKGFYPWRNADQRAQMSADIISRATTGAAPWTKEYLTPKLPTPGQIDFQAFTQGKKLADALAQADRQAPDLFPLRLMQPQGLSKAEAAILGGAIPTPAFSLLPASGMSKAKAAATAGQAVSGAAAAVPEGIPVVTLAPASLAALATPLAAMGAAAVAMIALPPILRSAADSAGESNRRFVGVNAAMAMSFAKLDISNLMRDIQIGTRIAPGAERLNRARTQMSDAWMETDVAMANVKNFGGLVMAKAGEGIARAISPISEGINRAFGNATDDQISTAAQMAVGAVSPIVTIANAARNNDWIGSLLSPGGWMADKFGQKMGWWSGPSAGKRSVPGDPTSTGEWLGVIAKSGPFITPVHPNNVVAGNGLVAQALNTVGNRNPFAWNGIQVR